MIGGRETLLVATLSVLLVACGPSGTASPAVGSPVPTASATPVDSAATPASSPTATLAATAPASPPPTPTATISGPSYDNPVYARDFPDPFVLSAGGTYYAYSTNSGIFNVPVLQSTDLASWERVGDAMTVLPEWSRVGHTWAPGVIQIGDRFVLYFTARHAESGRQCIGVAVADAPVGQFSSAADEPLICQLDLGGSIDPYPFRDTDGTLHLYWKNDGNCCGLDVFLWGQRLSDDGLTLLGGPVQLLERDQAWERPLIENPAMVEHDGGYYLFYSGNRWDSVDYAVGYGTCETALGPCQKPRNEPILTHQPESTGPGGQAFFHDEEGNLWMAYHAWTGIRVNYPAGERSLRLEPVSFEGGEPVVEGPTTDPQPMP